MFGSNMTRSPTWRPQVSITPALTSSTYFTGSLGLMPVKIMEHYWGNVPTRLMLEAEVEASQETGVEEEEFSFEEFEAEQETTGPILAIPRFESLVTEGHFHLLSFAMIFFICGFIISFARIPVAWKNTLILAPFIGSVFDIWSTLLTRFVGRGFAWMLMLSGTVMAVSFALVFGISVYQMWFAKSEGKDRT